MTTPLRWQDRFRLVRSHLDLDQDQMGRKLGVSREWVSKLERGKEEPSFEMQTKLERMESEVGLRKSEPLLPSGKTRRGEPLVQEGPSASSPRYGLADPDLGAAGRPMPTRKDCEDLLRRVLDAAQGEGSPENIPVIFHRLKKQFPMEEWESRS